MGDTIQVRRVDAITVIVIDRPEARNALDLPRHVELSRIFDTFAADATQRVAILTGAGDLAFCAGNDLKQRLVEGQASVPSTGFGGLCARTSFPKPVIAAVNGLALGGGFELALACDLVVASQNATFGLPEAKLGMAALAGGLLRLPMHIGPKLASELILTGRRIRASEALDLGLVNAVVPTGQALDAALELAGRVAESAPLAIAAAKAVMRIGIEASINRALPMQMDIDEVRTMRASSDAGEGVRAFIEKRTPKWLGQ